MYTSLKYGVIISCLAMMANPVFAEEEESDPAEIAIGERLFLETRFAQFFFAQKQVGTR
jgi:hypothetical protein